MRPAEAKALLSGWILLRAALLSRYDGARGATVCVSMNVDDALCEAMSRLGERWDVRADGIKGYNGIGILYLQELADDDIVVLRDGKVTTVLRWSEVVR